MATSVAAASRWLFAAAILSASANVRCSISWACRGVLTKKKSTAPTILTNIMTSKRSFMNASIFFGSIRFAIPLAPCRTPENMRLGPAAPVRVKTDKIIPQNSPRQRGICFAPGPKLQCHGEKSDDGREGSHQHRTKPDTAGDRNSVHHFPSLLFSQMTDELNDQNTVLPRCPPA